MQTVLIIYKLNKGVSLKDYIKWSKEVDQPKINTIDYIKDYAPHYILGPEKIWHIFEVIKVNKWEDWEKFSQSDTCKYLTKQWLKYADENSVKIVYGNRIEYE